MDRNDRETIEQLFDKLRQVEGRTGPRDAEAEALINAKVAGQPGAAYYLAQTVVMQEQALGEAQRRIEELESQPQSSGGFLGALFGGGAQRQPPRSPMYDRRAMQQPEPPQAAGQRGPWGGAPGAAAAAPAGRAGGGFLAGAAQTAMGVAGGVVLGNMLAGMFSGGGSANAAERGGDQGSAGDNGGASDFNAHPDAQYTESDYFSGSDSGGGDFGGGDGGGGGD